MKIVFFSLMKDFIFLLCDILFSDMLLKKDDPSLLSKNDLLDVQS